jgi:hypothetical protein
MAGTIKHRHQTAIAGSGADVDKNEWNDSLVAAGGNDGQLMQRDSAQADGWKFASVLTQDTYANRAAATGKGLLYLPTDGYTLGLDIGASWDTFGPNFPFVPPTDPGTWVNQGTSTVASTADSVVLTGGATAAGANLVARVGAHAAPKTYTMFCLATMLTRTSNGGFNGYGLCLRESSTGKFHCLGVTADASGNMLLRVMKYTTATSFSADYNPPNNPRLPRGINWFRLSDNNINIVASISEDGQNWVQVHTISRTDFLLTGPDQYGVFLSTENTTTPNWAPVMTVLSLSAV